MTIGCINSTILYRNDLTISQKVLLTAILCELNQNGYCDKTNGYFAKKLSLSIQSIDINITVLKQKELIFIKNSGGKINRKLFTVETYYKFINSTQEEENQ